MRAIVVKDHLILDGGADVVALASARVLAAAGIEVSLLVGERESDAPAPPPGVGVVSTGQGNVLGHPDRFGAAEQDLWSLPAASATHELLARHDPRDTVVHLHSWTKALSASVVRAATRAGFRLVLTLRDYFIACPNGAFADFQRGAVCHKTPMSWDCVSTHCDSRHYAYKLYRMARQALQAQHGGLPGDIGDFIVVSCFSGCILRAHLPDAATLHLVRNPIDVPASDAADVTTSRRFVMAARMLQPKGQQLFLQACERAGVEAVCIGDGHELAALRERFTSARFPGQLPRDEVQREMRAARVVMLALWYETQGLVVDKAASMGLPTIVSDGCAASEAVVHERRGLHFASGDVDALAAAIGRLAAEPALAARLGAQANADFWRAPPTLQRHAEGLMAVYRKVLGQRARAA